jgi:hypothetical protein
LGERPPDQLSLFTPEDVYSQLRITAIEAFDWYNVGFLSFDPRHTSQWERWMCWEAVFVRDLMRAEFSLNAVRRMLSKLDRPYAYRHEDIFFHFGRGTWLRRCEPKGFVGCFERSPNDAITAVVTLLTILSNFGCARELRQIENCLKRLIEGSAN